MTTHTLAMLVLCALLLVPAAPAAAQEGADLQDRAAMETFFDGLMAAQLEAHHIPGAVVALVVDGDLLFSKGYGYADVAGRIAVDPDETLFRPGSVSKLFTWTAVMQLVEAGRLNLQADVNHYLDFTIPSTYPQPITLAHLMTHTPGFEDRGQGLFVLDEADLISLEEYVKSGVPERVFPPGEVGAYSNYGTALAGYIVQRVSGQPFETYVEQHILAPLGMAHTTFRQPLPPALAGSMARGYGFVQGEFVAGDFEFIAGMPAGSTSATAADMARFMIAYLQGGQYGTVRILQPETVAEMQAPQWVPDPRSTGMGYGFFLTERNNRRIVHHGGDTILFHSGLFLLPDENTGLFVSYNSAGGALAREELLQAFLDRFFPTPPPEPLDPPPDFASRASIYVGEYHLARANYSTVEKLLTLLQAAHVTANRDGYLVVTMAGAAKQYVEVEPGLFRHRSTTDAMIFQMDDTGDVTAVMIADTPVMTALKAPPYATSGFTGLLVIGGLLFFLLSLLGWAVAYFARRGVEGAQPMRPLARLARWVVVLFTLLALLFLILFMGIVGDVDPAYGVPAIFFGPVPALAILPPLTMLIVVLAGAMLLLAAAAWLRRDWGWFGRIHYTLLALAALGWVWLLVYWNLLGAAA